MSPDPPPAPPNVGLKAAEKHGTCNVIAVTALLLIIWLKRIAIVITFRHQLSRVYKL